MTITLGLIAVNVAVSLFALYYSEKFFDMAMLRPYRTVRQQTWYEVISSGFVHGSITHLFVNMFVLFFFGSVVEDVLGTSHFLALYFSGLIFSALPSLYSHKDNPNYATIGASGAVEAILFSYIFVFPTEKIMLVLLPIPIPAWFFGLGFLAYSVYESKKGAGNVNHAAHLAGAFWGVFYLLIFVPNSLDHILTILGVL